MTLTSVRLSAILEVLRNERRLATGHYPLNNFYQRFTAQESKARNTVGTGAKVPCRVTETYYTSNDSDGRCFSLSRDISHFHQSQSILPLSLVIR
jgi:hypothetical protein